MKRVLVVLGMLALLAPASGQAAKQHTFGAGSVPCGDNGSISWTPKTLWPPNHKMHTVTFTYSDPDADSVSLVVTAKPHSDTLDDGTELNGSGNTPAASDQTGGANTAEGTSVDVAGSARAERSGTSKAGRTYRYEYMASADEDGDRVADDGCASDPDDNADDLVVFVPHDCRKGACKG